jgi:hypothetical protein
MREGDAADRSVFLFDIFIDAVVRTLTRIAAFLVHPNGASSVEIAPELAPTIPYSRRSVTRKTRPLSLV